MSVPAWFAEVLHKELEPWVAVTTDQIDQLYRHFELLERWNQRMNLTTIASGSEIVLRHYCESVFFAAQFPNEPISIADIGSGAGFPGIPMAVLHANWKLTLVESNQRKAVFLREATRMLQNVEVRGCRSEDLSVMFDWLVSRAVPANEVLALIPRLAPRIGLMIGEDDIPLLKSTKHVAWSELIRLPWGDRRVCMFGKYVSRGT